MNFFSNIITEVKRRKAEMDDRKEFLRLVEEKTRPAKRSAYLKQMFLESIKEGTAKAKADAEARLPKPKPKESDFGLGESLQDPYKFINQSKLNKEKL